MHHRSPASRRRRQAFTLVEVLLSLALIASLLLAMNQFILSMGELWGRNREQRLFDQHVRAVTRYLEDLLRRGSLAPEPAHRVRMEAGTGPGAGSGPLLTFDLPAGDRLLPWPDRPLPDVQCSLDVVPGQGLMLYWQSRWELDFERSPPRRTVISPLVGRMEYEYFRPDGQTWTAEPPAAATENGGPPQALPTRIRLHFKHERFSADEMVLVPPAVTAMPVF